jgi:hypothetical protein
MNQAAAASMPPGAPEDVPRALPQWLHDRHAWGRCSRFAVGIFGATATASLLLAVAVLEGGGHPTGRRMAMNPVTRGCTLWIRDSVDRARGCIEAIRVGHGRSPEPSSRRPVSLREDLARFMGEHPAPTTSAAHRPAALHPFPPAVLSGPASGSPGRRRSRSGPLAVTWLAAASVAGAVVLGSLARGLVTRATAPTPSAIAPRGVTAGTSLRMAPAAPLEMSPSTTSRVTVTPPTSPTPTAPAPGLQPPSPRPPGTERRPPLGSARSEERRGSRRDPMVPYVCVASGSRRPAHRRTHG